MPVPITGPREITSDQKVTLDLHVQELKALGFEVREVETSLKKPDKYICSFVEGDLPNSRRVLGELGFEVGVHKIGGRLAGWAISKRKNKNKESIHAHREG